MDDIRLTSFSPFGGCGAKLPAEYLEAVLRGFKDEKGDKLLVGIETLDDATVYKLGNKLVLFTIDFFTPVVDDPYVFGQIAAANAINDIYAKGGVPLMALNLAEFPVDYLDIGVLDKILKGGKDKINEAGAIIAGGHTLKGSELKYGMAVMGVVKPNRLLRNSTAKPGDKLILTRPLGVGIISTAIKRGIADNAVIKKACGYMTALNDKSSDIMGEIGANACTDVTGFGLIGHALGMAKGSSVGIKIHTDSVPYIEEAIEFAKKGVSTNAACTNRSYFSGRVSLEKEVCSPMLDLLYDPQTTGGLLISVPTEKAGRMICEMQKQKIDAVLIGEVMKNQEGRIILT